MDPEDIPFGSPSVALPRTFHDPLFNEPAQTNGAAPASFSGLTHTEVLTLTFEAERFLIDELIPAGAVGTIAGVPETHKSWLAQAITVRYAAGQGHIFGHTVSTSGPAGYFWQDDSTREEAERVQLFEAVHTSPPDLPVRWYLNEGLRLPDDIARLHATVVQHGFGLIVLDSFYNILFGLDLKDEGAEQVVAVLKRDIADATGCTVLIVDHMPWATDTNRGRLRAYGGVFKNAATRFGIYIDAQGKKLWIEARGNNLRGFKKTLAEWDEDVLELKLIENEDEHVSPEEYEERVLEFIAANPWSTTKEVNAGVTGRAAEIRAARTRLSNSKRIITQASRDLGRVGRFTHWNLAPVNEVEATRDPGTLQETLEASTRPQASPYGETTPGSSEVDAGETEQDDETRRLLALYATQPDELWQPE